jgi:alpha-galactosidase
MEGCRGSPWTRLPALTLLLLACAVAVGEARVVHVGEAHRRSMLANGLGSTPPMG